ncbi:coiled-coil-helix-coiled-coil-helix domain containing 6b isoform X2 [Rhinichthys klamathensis goyatoka]|uniref:coiled-coil-helix-coiled-coil-helix domain containing 6b isoform X2 n=1 Tax=Rhinichthys klamathensis goyatoka TaxID=3034132 RepID=UPI0024B55413|nr:coiled-coil-helix-coiled-coil-helix domain containing 6b isoform X2 [Rhinichthys klamathensis goyatoka]
MGAADSRSGSVSYGLDEQDKVTVLQGVKLSGDVLQRMRESGSSPGKPASPKPERDTPDPGASRPSAGETPEELRRRFEREQALVQEELTRIARRERETAMGDDMREKANTHPDRQKTHTLARQLKKKEDELKHLEQFYKEQLQLMEKKNTDFYQQTLHMYTQEAVKAEATVKPGHMTPVCAELQSQVLSCYTLNTRHTLLCSQLARDYIHCINSCKKNLLVNHG